jgi:hypothetical protein
MIVPKCDVCGDLVDFAHQEFYSESVSDPVTWIAHEKCLPNCPRCGNPIGSFNCKLRKVENGYHGYQPEHQTCHA